MARTFGEAWRRVAAIRPVQGTGWLVVAVALASAAWIAAKLLSDSAYVFLNPAAPGRWIVPDDPPELVASSNWELIEVDYRRRFAVEHAVPEWRIEFVALSEATVVLDGEVLLDELQFDAPPDAPEPTATPRPSWKRRRIVRSQRPLLAGPHELLVHVAHVNGPAALSLAAPQLGLVSDGDWEARAPRGEWKPVRRADAPFPVPDVSLCHPTVGEALRRTAVWGILVVLLAGVAVWSLDALRPADATEPPRRGRRIAATLLSPAAIRWLLLALWLLRGANNLALVPYNYGFDLRGHMDYVVYVADKHRVPLANEGWQGFKPPLYYVLSAGLGKLFVPHSDLRTLTKFLWFVPLACGLVQIELCFRVLRSAFPGRRLVQGAGLVVAALLPMHAAISQFMGNEPLAGCLTAACTWQLFRLVEQPRRAASIGQLALLGTFVGLSLLAKVSLLALLPVIGFYVAWAALREPTPPEDPLPVDAAQGTPAPHSVSGSPSEVQPRDRSDAARTTDADAPHSALFGPVAHSSLVPVEEPVSRGRRVLRTLLVWPGVALLLCGWYFARNWIELGKPFFGGWDPGRGIVWWQLPGYRTLTDLTTFGRALDRPIYATLGSFWDGLYSTLWLDGMLSGKGSFADRPPWNIDLHLSLAAFSLVPTLFLLAGLARGVRALLKGEAGPVAVATALLLALLGALFVLFLKLPVYSTVKASYTLGLLPAYGVLVASGVEPFARTRLGRAATAGLLAAWATCAYAAFFVVERFASPP